MGALTGGARAYICVRGGIDVEPVLGSRSTDLLTGLGPPPLRAGDLLADRAGACDPAGAIAAAPTLDEPVLRIQPGPRDDWFAPEALDALVGTSWRVSPSSNRVGIRLEGASARTRARDDELLLRGPRHRRACRCRRRASRSCS